MEVVVHVVFALMAVWALVVPWLWGRLRPGGRPGRLVEGLRVLVRRWWLGLVRRLGAGLGLDGRRDSHDLAGLPGRPGKAASSAVPERPAHAGLPGGSAGPRSLGRPGWAVRLAASIVGACLVGVAWWGTLVEVWGTTTQGDTVRCGASVAFMLDAQAEWDGLVAHGCVFRSRVVAVLLVTAALLVLRAQRWALRRLAGGPVPTPTQ